jgi:hypothetical protein
VERGVASAAYSFVRFGGGAIAPWLAGKLGERSVHVPFWVGSAAVLLAVAVLLTARREINAVDDQHADQTVEQERPLEAAALTVGDA